MVYDSIDNFIKYVPLYLPKVKELIPLLEAAAKNTFEEIQGMDLSPLDLRFGEYETRYPKELPFEAHRRLWDFQIVLEGTERLCYAPLERLKETIPYNKENDIAFYSGTGDMLTIGNGMAILLAPWDGHCPGLTIADPPSYIRKIVAKLAW